MGSRRKNETERRRVCFERRRKGFEQTRNQEKTRRRRTRERSSEFWCKTVQGKQKKSTQHSRKHGAKKREAAILANSIEEAQQKPSDKAFCS